GARGHGAEQAAQQRADGQPDPERGLVEADRARARPGGGADDRRQGGGDDHSVARPQPARRPRISSPPSAPAASAAKSTTSSRPISRVRFTPAFEANQLVKNIASAVMNR